MLGLFQIIRQILISGAVVEINDCQRKLVYSEKRIYQFIELRNASLLQLFALIQSKSYDMKTNARFFKKYHSHGTKKTTKNLSLRPIV